MARQGVRVVRLGPGSNVSRVSFLGKPLAKYRWSHSASVWVRSPMPPRYLLEEQPEFPPAIRPSSAE